MISFGAKYDDAAQTPENSQSPGLLTKLKMPSLMGVDPTASHAIVEENRKNLQVYSTVMAVAFLFCIIGSFFNSTMEPSRPLYIVYEILGAVLLFLSFKRTAHTQHVVSATVMFLSLAMMAFGIALGTITSPNTPTVAFNVLLFAVPILFTYAPWKVVVLNCASIAAYTVFAVNTQSAQMLQFNLVNVCIFGALGIVLGVYVMRLKIQRAAALYEAQRLSEHDVLTDLLNRRIYQRDIAEISEGSSLHDVTIVAIDLNGLQRVNHTQGYKAGDALLVAAADCLVDVFSEWGKVYRTGGDEFAVIIKGGYPPDEVMQFRVKMRASHWRDELGMDLSMSIGFAHGCEFTETDEMLKAANLSMCEEKARYYRETGVDRRHRAQ